MVFKKIAGLFGGSNAEEEMQVFSRALMVHGLREYNETNQELDRLQQAFSDAPTKSQKADVEKLRDRVQCRQDAIRSAAVVLFHKLGENADVNIENVFGVTEKDIAKVAASVANNRETPAQQVVQFLVEEAESDIINGRV